MLDIEETEIAACAGYSVDGLSIIFYDTAAGGAGHVHRLLKAEAVRSMLRKTLQIVSECQCDSSCYSCLRSYSNQKYHERLDRHLVLDYLTPFVSDNKSWEQCEFAAPKENEDVLDKYQAEIRQIDTVHVLQDGIRLGDDFEEIFDALEDEVEASDACILQRLKTESINLTGVESPYGSMSLKIGIDEDELYPLIYWPKSKVMLIYHATEKQISALIGSGWHVIPLDEKTTCIKIRLSISDGRSICSSCPREMEISQAQLSTRQCSRISAFPASETFCSRLRLARNASSIGPPYFIGIEEP